MTRTYNIGKSNRYGNIIAVSENLTTVSEEDFFKAIKNSIKHYQLQKYEAAAMLVKNLKQGVTLGNDYYLIKDTKTKLTK